MPNDTITFTTSPRETQTITLLPGTSVSLLGSDGKTRIIVKAIAPNQSLMDSIADLETRLTEMVKERDIALQRGLEGIDKAEVHISTMKRELNNANTRANELETRLANVVKERDAANMRADALREGNRHSTDSYAQLRIETSQLQRERDFLRTENMNLKEDVSSLQKLRRALIDFVEKHA